jgi:beta-glucuronidase
MKKYHSLLLALISLTQFLFPQDPILHNVSVRTSLSLNGTWNYIVDPYENGYYNYRYEPFDNAANPSRSAYFMDAKQLDKSELLEYDFDRSETITVPGDWNTQKERLFYYEGTVWYRTLFDLTTSAPANRVFLHFGAVNYRADIYLNGKKLGQHIGGFTPFSFEVTGLIKERRNSLVVKVDNKRTKEGVPTLNTDWWNYGGITRDVKIVETPSAYIADHVLQLDAKDGSVITGHVTLSGKDVSQKNITVEIPELSVKSAVRTDSSGTVVFSLRAKNIIRWSPSTPKLYTVTVSSGSDRITDRIGFRSVRTSGAAILLNDRPLFLRGISIHEESPFTLGRAHTPDDARTLLSRAKELGCNFVRLAHYPHNEHMVRMADSMGILVWEEIPVYWTIDWMNPGTYRNAEDQLSAMIMRDRNRASVIIWSMANETPVSDARNSFLGRLAARARAMDGTRLISAALEQSSVPGQPNTRTITDPFAETVDILSFNQYIGWYDGLPDKCLDVQWKITQQKPVVISEFGADAKYGYHADTLTRFSEEYQEDLYKKTLRMLGTIQQLSGMSPWILTDFRSPRRALPGIQDGWNRKGLYSEKGEKKKAFFVLQQYYRQRAAEHQGK